MSDELFHAIMRWLSIFGVAGIVVMVWFAVVAIIIERVIALIAWRGEIARLRGKLEKEKQ